MLWRLRVEVNGVRSNRVFVSFLESIFFWELTSMTDESLSKEEHVISFWGNLDCWPEDNFDSPNEEGSELHLLADVRSQL